MRVAARQLPDMDTRGHAAAQSNTHHIIEACFKGLGRALRQAVAVDPALNGEIPSTKGVLRCV